VTDTPGDGGGPTAQAALDSIGSSTGYAAFPDPGGVIVSIPGLAAGFSGGAVPNVPYPLYVASDANSGEQSQGAGPYHVRANSTTASSDASATAGFQPDVVGNVSLATSTANITASATGVVAKAVADLQALTIGPLTIGEVKSSATQTLDPSGTVTPKVSLTLTGLRVGGIPFELSPQGVIAGGTTYPAPINPMIKQLLSASGITMEFVAAQRFPGRVVAPALRIRAPLRYSLSGNRDSSMTLTVGVATAALTGSSAAPSSGIPVGGSSEGSGTAQPAASTGGGALGAGQSLDTGSGAGTSASPVTGTGGAVTTPAAPTRSTTPLVARTFDIGPIYLLLVVAGLAALGVGQLIRVLGGRRSWTSLGG
jgi:hypothetical protein